MKLFRASLGIAALVLCAVPLLVYSTPPQAAPPPAAVTSGDLNLTFTTIDVPGAINTNVLGINTAGQMVGYFVTTINGPATGFLRSEGIFTFFTYPGADSTQAWKINDSGLIAGTAFVAQNTGSAGFVYSGGAFTTIRVSGKTNTFVQGMNNGDDIVGGDGTVGETQAFERVGSRFRDVTPPPGGWIAAGANGINNLGEIVGGTSGASTNGFWFKHGKFQTITYPGTFEITDAWDINDSDIIVGSYEAASGFTGFALMNGKYISINYPGAEETFAFGINNVGQIVGSYTFDQQTFHGFVTSSITAADFVAETTVR